MREQVLSIPTRDGLMPTEMFAPDLSRRCPGVVIYMDVFGIREELRDMCRRYATTGYAVFLPNLFYRYGSPSFPPANRPTDIVDPEAKRLNHATTAEMTVDDTGALLDYTASMDIEVPAFATVGYCMGARHALAAAAEFPDKIGAAISLHGGQMINDTALSCEKTLPRIQGEVYLGFAKQDATCPDAHQKLLEETLRQSATRGRAEYYEAAHGWTFPDRHCFDKAAANRSWENIFHILQTNVAGLPSVTAR